MIVTRRLLMQAGMIGGASLLINRRDASAAVPAITALSDTEWGRVGQLKKLDPYLLYAVALIESADAAGARGFVAPQPFMIRSPSGTVCPDTEQAARAALSRIPIGDARANTDVGFMQINLGAHGRRVADHGDLLVPSTNLSIGADILCEALASTNDFTLGVGRYHSWTEWRARWYGQRVVQTYNTASPMK